MAIRHKERSPGTVFSSNYILEIFNGKAINSGFKKVTMMEQQQILLFLTWVF